MGRYGRCCRRISIRNDAQRSEFFFGLVVSSALLLNRTERRNGADFLRFQLFRLFGLAIAVPVISSHVFSYDGPVPINPTPTVDDNSAAAANKQRWRLPGFGHG